MAVPKTTLWEREPHTAGKHLVLESYLKAWFPIMARRNPRILFVDGFAGPGEYLGGEEGSPIIAMRAWADHVAGPKIKSEVIFVFIEEQPDRVRHLERLVDRWDPKLPETAKVHVWPGTFDSLMTEALDQLAEQHARMAPALVMMDPFGVKGIPIDVIERILGNEKCEVYVTFMWEAINRHVGAPEFEGHLTRLFGTDGWKDAIRLEGRERKLFLHRLYRRQLKAAGARQVVHFHLLKGKRLKYSIFFGTGHTLGSDRMKEAIWKADPSGDYSFRGGEQAQISFLEPNFEPLQEALQERFEAAGWVSIKKIEEFVRSDATIFHTGQLRLQALIPMERAGRIEVKVNDRIRKKGSTYPKDCLVNFRPEAPRFL